MERLRPQHPPMNKRKKKKHDVGLSYGRGKKEPFIHPSTPHRTMARSEETGRTCHLSDKNYVDRDLFSSVFHSY